VRYDTPGLQTQRRAWTTNAELSQWLDELASTPADRTSARRIDLGPSQNGTPLLALALNGTIGDKPLLSNGRPTVLLVGQQHGDEPGSSEALLVMARELAQGLLAPMLQRINVVSLSRGPPPMAPRPAAMPPATAPTWTTPIWPCARPRPEPSRS